MSFIGIVCDKKSANHVEKKLKKILKNNTIVIFNEENIENFKNIKFETIAILKNNTKIISKKEILKSIISKANYLIINEDEEINLELLQHLDANIITYGFNSKSTITASSVNEDELFICLQRTILDINGEVLEPQEISVLRENLKINTDIIMGIETILLLYNVKSIDTKRIDKVKFKKNCKNCNLDIFK